MLGRKVVPRLVGGSAGALLYGWSFKSLVVAVVNSERPSSSAVGFTVKSYTCFLLSVPWLLRELRVSSLREPSCLCLRRRVGI